METLFEWLFNFRLAFWGVCFIILIYLIIQRIEAKKAENFEDRDN